MLLNPSQQSHWLIQALEGTTYVHPAVAQYISLSPGQGFPQPSALHHCCAALLSLLPAKHKDPPPAVSTLQLHFPSQVAQAFGLPYAGTALGKAASTWPVLAGMGKCDGEMCQVRCSVVAEGGGRSRYLLATRSVSGRWNVLPQGLP